MSISGIIQSIEISIPDTWAHDLSLKDSLKSFSAILISI